MTESVITRIRRSLARHGLTEACSGIKLRSKPAAPMDAVVYFGAGRQGPGHEALEQLVEDLERQPWVEDIQRRNHRRRGRSLGLRFADATIEGLGADLAAGRPPRFPPGAGLDGRRYGVQFLDPNLSKALHVGHLRNIVLGNAFAALLRTAGAEVVTRAYCCDIGRNVCEAIAGTFGNGQEATSPPTGVKPDHFVGERYAEYVRAHRLDPASSSAARSPIARELELSEDPADRILHRWLQKEPTTRERWRQLRRWVRAGQEETLRTLGVRIDEPQLQSDTLDELDRWIGDGLQRGVLTHAPDRRVLYRSGREEFESLTLVKSDGVSTEYGRLAILLSQDQRLADRFDGYLSIAGDEWKSAGPVLEELLGKMGPCPLFERFEMIYYGMVTVGGSTMKSSVGGALLIDDLVPRLATSRPVRDLVRSAGGAVSAVVVADLLIKSYFLSRPPHQELRFEWDRLLDPRQNRGWQIARALCLAAARARDTRRGDLSSGERSSARFFILRAQEFPEKILHAISSHRFRGLLFTLEELSDAYLEAPTDGFLARIVANSLRHLIGSVGVSVDSPINPATARGETAGDR